jgi:hypothetical protein
MTGRWGWSASRGRRVVDGRAPDGTRTSGWVEHDGRGGILLDFDRAGQMISVEILGARELLPGRFLDGAIRPGHPG